MAERLTWKELEVEIFSPEEIAESHAWAEMMANQNFRILCASTGNVTFSDVLSGDLQNGFI